MHLAKDGGHHKRPEYKAVNPQMRVPALVLSSGETLIQSMAIMEYLDEVYPEPPLLPAEDIERARVRAVAQIVACDIHPLNNSGTMAYLRKIGHDDAMINEWYAYWVTSGFEAIEAMIKPAPLRVRIACHDRRYLPHSANLQCAPVQGAARQIPENPRRRGGLQQAARLRQSAAGKPAGCGMRPPRQTHVSRSRILLPT